MNKELFFLRTLLIVLVLVLCVNSSSAQTIEELVNAGIAAYKQSDYKTAIEKFKRAIQKKPDLTSHIYFLLGDSYEKVSDQDNAIRVYEMVADRSSSTVLLRLIDLYLRQRKYDDVTRIADKLLVRFPENFEVYLRLARINVGRGEYEAAISMYKKFLAVRPNDIEAFKELATIYINLSNYAEAHKIGDALISRYPREAEPYLVKARIYGQQGHHDEAIELYKKALENKPNSLELHTDLAKLYRQRNQLKEAIASWEKAIKLNPKTEKSELGELCLSLASRYAQEGNIDSAIYYHLKLDPLGLSNEEIHLNVGKLYYRKADFVAAKRYAEMALSGYRKIIESNPLNPQGYASTMACYLVMNDLANAEAEVQKYLNRTKAEDRGPAAKMLEELVAEGVNVPDASYILKKYFAGVVERPAIVVSPTIEPAVRDTIPPQIVVLSPTTQRGMKNVEVSSYSVPIAGIASDDKGVSMVYINGIVAQLSAPTADEITRAGVKGKAVKFISEAMLTIGDNPVEIRVIDVSGNVAKETVKVHRSTTVISEKKS